MIKRFWIVLFCMGLMMTQVQAESFRPVKVPLRFIDFFALRNSKAVIHQFY